MGVAESITLEEWRGSAARSNSLELLDLPMEVNKGAEKEASAGQIAGQGVASYLNILQSRPASWPDPVGRPLQQATLV